MDVSELDPEVIDHDTLSQILEMDDDEEREFSTEIVRDFLSQADQTLKDLAEALEEKDLPKLSSLGHYLKGSSATIGLTKVKDDCEKIQNYGKLLDATGQEEKPRDECLKGVTDALADLETDHKEAKGILNKFFDLDEDDEGAEE